MNINQTTIDKAAIMLSTLCAIHCLALPLIITLLPLAASWGLENEAFHRSLLFAVLPLSLVATGLGCRKHKGFQVAVIIFAGLLLMVGAVALGHDLLGEQGEKILTLLGTALLVYGHWKNYKLCHKVDCACGTKA